MAKGEVTAQMGTQHIALDAKMQKEFEEKVKKIKPKGDDIEPGVIYVGHIPHGFFEPQMRHFFSQFGTVTRLRISRSRKSGRSKGYGFVEFEYNEVAKIAAETMNNYLTYNKLLKCHLMPKEKVHPELFKGCEHRFFNPSVKRKKAIAQYNSSLTADGHRVHKLLEKRARQSKARQKKIAKAGINYEFDGCVSIFFLHFLIRLNCTLITLPTFCLFRSIIFIGLLPPTFFMLPTVYYFSVPMACPLS
ncbi:MKI67 FHA domain-interacting nucleolar phosphoprotein-like [Anneissia japonica]|uniref:MKI67 FHA domain-interacting nucleolar phosphoprotein-like n=1 Tax=Anneissia japonica TaxID=1529436 RepID=UPI001425B509|nr:MKI67 FHA domain-interacting nucleolar phosphoprotein-like [Anneissia japonica]